jgi:ribosome biogenesis GTPase
MASDHRSGLEAWGWRPSFADQVDPADTVGRVVAEHRGAYDVVTAPGPATARLDPTLRKTAPDGGRRPMNAVPSSLELPTVGDWVVLGGEPDHPAIVRVLDRSSVLVRRAPGPKPRPQALVANADRVAVVMSMGDYLNPRLAERFLTASFGGPTEPAVVLTRLDEYRDPRPMIGLAQLAVPPDVPVVAVSNLTGEGIGELEAWFSGHRTVALVGPSGTGKSSLTNRLVGAGAMDVGALAADGTGRHTTVRRQLLRCRWGGCVVDMPGLREIVPWDAAGLDRAFPDVADVALRCRFADCSHRDEPGCAVREAAGEGSLDADRYRSWSALADEIADTQDRVDRTGWR